ncbi:MAG: 30S ribosomal protein S17e [Candidatus Altiarchaeota archaeon]|nr:30S ribosomal protein S17e [Candidatus Altiarchaeota archaeon]
MGKVRSTLIKRTARRTLKKYPERITKDFDQNKKAVSDLLIFPSKRMRNMVAGYITTLFKQKKE